MILATPAVFAGIVATHVGLHDTAIGYGPAVAALALTAPALTATALRGPHPVRS